MNYCIYHANEVSEKTVQEKCMKRNKGKKCRYLVKGIKKIEKLEEEGAKK